MMYAPLDELYLRWLYSQVASVKTRIRARTYWRLFKQLYTTEFIWLVPNDDNRVMDGQLLRDEFLADSELEVVDQEWMALNCSFLEMLIALSRRLSFEADGEPLEWFWHLMRNLELQDYTDNIDLPVDEVMAKVNQVIWRTYRKNGIGGLFPLKRPRIDQTEVEIWYQLNAYLNEMQS
jgi:hypothetical protein